MKILHIADIQIEVRGNHQRHNEYTHALECITEQIRTHVYDMLVITGDIYETPFRGSPPNASEINIFKTFLDNTYKYVKHIVITSGNHDIKQKDNEVIINTNRVSEPSILTTLDGYRDNIHHIYESGVYPFCGINFAVWAHEAKFDITKNSNYSPWIENTLQENTIELYHDPIDIATNFDGKVIHKPRTGEHKSLSVFKAPLVLAGDIHLPNTYKDNKTTFTYCSSLVQRHSGEGDKYKNGEIFQEGNTLHGYNVIDYTDDNTFEITFVPVKPYAGFNTYLFEDFDFSDLSVLQINNKYTKNNIKLVPVNNVADFHKHEQEIKEYLNSQCVCTFKTELPTNVISDTSIEKTDFSIDKLIDDKQIFETAKVFIHDLVKKTKTIEKDNKERAEGMLYDLFVSEYNKTSKTVVARNIDIQSLYADNFMRFDNIDVDLTQKDNITRINGTNGVGKTTMLLCLFYLLTDRVSHKQNMTKKTDNLLSYFNDGSDKDTVSVGCTFTTDKKYVLEKNIYRTWKKDFTDKKEKDWQKGIAKVTTEWKMVVDSEVLTDEQQIKEILENDVITFDDLQKLMFINQFTIESLLNMKTDDMNNMILNYIGMSFFSDMLENYDDIKSEYLLDYDYIDSTPELENEKIALENDKKIALEQNVIDANVFITKVKKEIDVLLQQKEELQKELKDVRSIAVVESCINDNNNNIYVKKDEINIFNDIAIPEGYRDDLTTDIADIDINVLKDKKSALNDTVKAFKADIQFNIINKESCIQKLKNENNNDIVISEKKINVYENSITEHKTKIESIHNEYGKKRGKKDKEIFAECEKIHSQITDLSNKSNELDISIQACVIEGKGLSKDIETLTSSINTIEQNRSCSECSKEYTDTEIAEKVKDKKISLDVLTKDQIEKSSLYAQLTNEKKELNTNVLYTKIDDIKKSALPKELPADLLLQIESINKEINVLESKKKAEQEVLEKTKANTDEYANNHDDVLAFDKDNESINIKIGDVEKDIENVNEQINNKEAEKVFINKCIEWFKEYNIKKLDIAYKEKDILLLEKQNVSLEKEVIEATANELIKEQIKCIDIDSKKEVLIKYESDIVTLHREILLCDENITKYKNNITKITDYTIATAVIKQYKNILGKKGLPRYIFSLSREAFNNEINNLLCDVNFRASFDTDLVFNLYDIENQTYRNTSFSGMEETFLGLSLINMLRRFNNSIRTNILFIDEISGKLNSGKKLKTESINYQQSFSDMITKISEHTRIFMVDHVVPSLGETRTLEFYHGDNGTLVHDYKTVTNDVYDKE